MMMLFLDTSSTLTGYAVGDGRVAPECGAWDFSDCGGDLGRLGLALSNRLRDIQRRTNFTYLGYESPLLIVRNPNAPGAGRPTDTLDKLRMLMGFGMVAETWALKRGIRRREAAPVKIKKALTGDSHAKKPAMVAAALRCGVTLPATDAAGRKDAADGFAGWYYCLSLDHPDRAIREKWDRIVYTQARGALT